MSLFRENRYLLLLTENYNALRILQQANLIDHDPLVLFGSSFPQDLNYTQVKFGDRSDLLFFKCYPSDVHVELCMYIP